MEKHLESKVYKSTYLFLLCVTQAIVLVAALEATFLWAICGEARLILVTISE